MTQKLSIAALAFLAVASLTACDQMALTNAPTQSAGVNAGGTGSTQSAKAGYGGAGLSAGGQATFQPGKAGVPQLEPLPPARLLEKMNEAQ